MELRAELLFIWLLEVLLAGGILWSGWIIS